MNSRPVTALLRLILAQLFSLFALLPVSQVAAAGLEFIEVRSSQTQLGISADGVVEAVRTTVIAAQVSGAITSLPVKAGDSMKAGQMLVRLDGNAARQQAQASQAQLEVARASLQVASKDYERQKQLFARQYISQAQLERAEAQFYSARADARALIAQAGAVKTQADFYVLTAPYTGRVADVYVSQGDMVTPGKALMTVFDPGALRVSVNLSEAQLARLAPGQTTVIEFPALPAGPRSTSINKYVVLPVADASTHTVQLRFDLPVTSGLAPGMFARLQLPVKPTGKDEQERLFVPVTAIVRRAELYAVYVVNPQGRAVLRQIKPGPVSQNEQEVLAGLAAGEKVVLKPIAAAQNPLRN